MTSDEPLLDEDAIARTLRRLAVSIVEETARAGAARVGLVGILRGGPPLAARIAEEMGKEGTAPGVGQVDIALYRDDAATALPDPKIGPSQIAFEVAGADVVLVDDVLQTGRTVRAAMDHLLDYGRPRRIWLAVLIDRGGRELPIAPNFVGLTVDVLPHVRVELVYDADGRANGARIGGQS